MEAKPEVKTLSERETEVLKLSAEGCGLKQIAILLNISEDTVDTHSRNVVSKLEVKNMKHAIATAIRKRIIE
ncbi:MAG: helix-turn-helix transcriptional regulator [Chitinophagales bacterium]|nr:helix-turn-helix transcriptional regulator [Chitinophagales bacterium]